MFAAREAGALERDEGLAGPEEAGLGGDPARVARLVVEVDLPDPPDLAPVRGDDVAVEVGQGAQLFGRDAHVGPLAVHGRGPPLTA